MNKNRIAISYMYHIWITSWKSHFLWRVHSFILHLRLFIVRCYISTRIQRWWHIIYDDSIVREKFWDLGEKIDYPKFSKKPTFNTEAQINDYHPPPPPQVHKNIVVPLSRKPTFNFISNSIHYGATIEKAVFFSFYVMCLLFI